MLDVNNIAPFHRLTQPFIFIVLGHNSDPDFPSGSAALFPILSAFICRTRFIYLFTNILVRTYFTPLSQCKVSDHRKKILAIFIFLFRSTTGRRISYPDHSYYSWPWTCRVLCLIHLTKRLRQKVKSKLRMCSIRIINSSRESKLNGVRYMKLYTPCGYLQTSWHIIDHIMSFQECVLCLHPSPSWLLRICKREQTICL